MIYYMLMSYIRDPRSQYEIMQGILQGNLETVARWKMPLEKRNHDLRRRMEKNLIWQLKEALKKAREMESLARQIEDAYPDGQDHYCFQCSDEIFRD